MSNPSKAKGTRFESAVCDYLRWALDDERIQRLTLHGAKDVGDIGNIYFHGAPVVIECKATRTPNWRKHWAECEVEMGNRDTEFGWIIRKRPGLGVDTRSKVGKHLAYTRKQTYFQMCDMADADLDHLTEKIPRNPLLIGLPVEQLALLLNHMQPLGPEKEEA
ncbi:hypothetical protein [Bifidobacterium choerinum]|uniref:Phage protein n=1 Tax=Bifidobacterium choerinum TaxID=35760 RepID=A0A087AFA4_9BIFI|nr:hypothetical protein [Bifidobacterium choerinum]KFI57454.1 phage protein [Bifidobacterium choerinum]